MLAPLLWNQLKNPSKKSNVRYVVPQQAEKAGKTTPDTAVWNKRAQFATANSSNYQDPSPA